MPSAIQGGLISSGCGLTPRPLHPGQEQEKHPHPSVQRRRENASVFQFQYDPRSASAHTHSGGRRHVDPQHVVVSDMEKLEQGRFGKAACPSSQRQAKGHLVVGANVPTETAQPLEMTPRRAAGYSTPRSGATSIQCSEAVLQRMLQDPDPVYREAAQYALSKYKGDSEVVQVEKRLTHQKAAAQFAAECAAKRAKEEALLSQREAERRKKQAEEEEAHRAVYHSAEAARRAREEAAAQASHRLGHMNSYLAAATPFALDIDSAAPQQASADTKKTGVKSSYPPKHYQTNFSSIQFASYRSPAMKEAEQEKVKDVPAPFTTAPYDSIATVLTAGSDYPSPPPVGVSQGLMQKPFLVKRPSRCVGGETRSLMDADTLLQRRAEAIRQRHSGSYQSEGKIVICGSEMMGCNENHSEYNQRYNPQSTTRRQHLTLVEEMEQKARAKDQEIQHKKTGKAPMQFKKTALW